MLLLKSKAGVRCPKTILDTANYNVNVCDIYVLCLTTFSFNYFEVYLALSFWFFLVQGYLSITFDNQTDLLNETTLT